ncbi:MAG: hypothetical protein ACFFD2_15520 [Promethearchaeota archaeon]
MVKGKKIVVYVSERFPSNLNMLFDKFVSIFEKNLGQELVYDKISELGPRENLSTTFQIGINDFKINFEIQNSKLVINFIGNKKILKIISPFIINSVSKTIESIN